MQRRCRRDQRQERQKRHAGEIIPRQSRDKPPAPPCFCFAASLLQQDRVNGKIMPEAKGEGGSSERQRLRGSGVLGGCGSVCGRSAGVRCCAHLRWPTPVRPEPDSRVKGRDFQIFWKEHRGPGCKSRSEGCLSTLWGPGRRQISMRSVEALEEDVALFGNVCAVQAQKRAARLKNASPCTLEKERSA